MGLINRKIILLLALIAAVPLIIMACGAKKEAEQENTEVGMIYSGKRYEIEVSDTKDIISKCPKSGKSGESVTIKTYEFMDVIPQIFINGEDIGSWNDRRTEYSFVMPEEKVEVTTRLKRAAS